MKIYASDILLHDVNVININKYFHKSKQYKILFSDAGIYEITKNTLHKLIPCDKITTEMSFNYNNRQINLVCDKSYYNHISNISQLPYNYNEFDYDEKEYKINDNSLLSLVIQYNGDNINNIYFISKDNIQLSEIKDDIITFLSLIKNI
jgi:hypothetical protein